MLRKTANPCSGEDETELNSNIGLEVEIGYDESFFRLTYLASGHFEDQNGPPKVHSLVTELDVVGLEGSLRPL